MGESRVASLDDPISIDLMAQDTITLVKHLGIKRFNLLGISMGGRIALCVALNVPSGLKLEKLIICSSSAKCLNTPAFENLYNLPKLDLPTTIEGHKDAIMKSFDKNFTNFLLEHPDKLDKLAELALNAHRPFEIFKRQWEAIKKSDLSSRLSMIKVPTLIIHGEADDIIPIQEGELLAREIPNTKLIKIPENGHMCLLMKSKSGPEPAVLISNFLSE